MASNDVAVRPRRSAFAAAFLSFLFPGLGHAYLGRWLRALLWATPPILVIAGLGGLAITTGVKELAGNLFDPSVLTGVIAFLVIDFLYRLFALLDAYRLASDPSVGSAGSRMLSSAGLVAIIVILVGSHVAVAQPVFFASDTLNDIADNAGDASEVLTPEELRDVGGKQFELITEEQTQQKTPKPGSTAKPRATRAPATEEPTAEPSLESEPTEGPLWDGKERLNILLIGSDGGRVGRADGSLLTDTMITISVDPTTGRVAFISLPRDTAGVPLPSNWAAYRQLGGKYNNKINTLYVQARANSSLFPGNDKERGYSALMGALGQLYGLDIKYYVSVDLNSFRAVVNSLGGVVVDVQLPVYDTGYPTDDGRGKLKLYVQPGMRKMNGQESLAYARSRHGSSDFDRSARQQRVVTSVRDQTDLQDLLKPGVINDLIKLVRKDVKTNIPPKMVPKLVSLAQDIDLDRRENLVLSSSRFVSTCYPCGSSGLWMLKAKPGPIKSAVKNIFSTSKAAAKSINAIAGEGAVVHVLNGTGGPNTKSVKIAGNLSKKGMAAIVPPVDGGKADANDYTNTVITFYNGAEEDMPATAKRLKQTFGDKEREIVSVDDPDAEADVVVVVGTKTAAPKG
jgi:polyisoprenyl-teichoic acid--peptidoglycan teichoic acid transferase